MDRYQIKKEAKEFVKDNIWNIWKALLVNLIVSFLYTFLFAYVIKDSTSLLYNVLSLAYNLVTIPLMFGISRYLLKLLRKEEYNFSDLFYYYKHNVLEAIIVSFIISILTSLGIVLFLFPAIYVAILFSQSSNLFVDGYNKVQDNLKTCIEIMKNYKWDYFNFLISFLGWLMLGIMSFGILLIWVLPYMMMAQKIYYEKLKKEKNL